MPRPRRPTPIHPVDWRQASRFHELLHGTAETEYRFIRPGGGRPEHRWGDLLDTTDPQHPALVDLQRLNDDGYGAYMVINHVDPAVATKIHDGRGGATDTDILEATALFVDVDRQETTPGANLAMLEDAEVPPSLIVQSSAPHKVHAYWLLDDCPIDLWRRLQVQLIAHFGADPACKNPSRIMRVPGFWHTKGTPVQTRILSDPGTVYQVDELVELFNLDPELELYSDRPAQPPPDWTPDKQLIARLKASARNVATRITEDAKQGKSGRHQGLMFYAMLLRENGATGDIANELMEYFIERLPDRDGEPVPFEEARGVMEWVNAKEAGRNPPMHRPTGLEAVTVANSEPPAPAGSGSGDDLDDITSAAARAPITIQSGGYAKVKDTKDGPVYTQLTNWVFTPTVALRWPDGSTGHRGELAVNTTSRHTIDVPAKAWASRRDLLAVLAPYDAVVFANSNSDVALIRQFILTNHPGLPSARGVTTYGLHKLGDRWEQLYQDTHHPGIFYVGTPVDPGPAYKTIAPGTAEEVDAARRTIALLPHLITPHAALALLGYGMASAYAPRITPHLGDRLPFLYLTGERESGKSSSIELVLTLTTGHSSARLRKAPGLTPYQYDSSFANLNNRLAALDEYRPGALDDAQLRKHHDLGVKWRGSGIAAKDHAYHLNSPLVVAGEGFTEDAAALSRGPLYFIAKSDRGDVDTYLRAQAAPNHAYARHLADAAAALPEEEHLARLERARALAKAATEARGGPRLQFALTYIAYGLLHLQADGLDFVTDTAIQRTLEVGVVQTLDGGDESKTNVETFLEQLGAALGEVKDPAMYLVPGAVPGTVIIRVSPAVELVKRRYKDPAIPNTRNLRQFSQRVDWIDTNSVHKALGNHPVRGIKIDLAAAPDRCDLSALEYVEEVLRRAYTG